MAAKTKKRNRRPKLDIKGIREAFKKNGDLLVTKTYIGTKQVLVYRCGGCKKHRTVVFNNYSRGCRCGECANRKQYNPNSASLKKIILRAAHYSMTDVCRIFGFPYDDFRNYVQLGLLTPPSKDLGAKMYYVEEDLEKIRSLVYLEGDKIEGFAAKLQQNDERIYE